MRAVRIGADGTGAIESLPAPRPAAGEIVLGLVASGFCGTDLFKIVNGLAAGAVLGHEIVGEVVAAGDGVTAFAPGDRVVVPHHVACGACRLCRAGAETQCEAFRANRLAPGGFADAIRVDAVATARAARKLPPGLDPLDALFLEPAACVLRSVARSGLEAAAAATGSAIAAIFGGGSMGLLHLLVLRAVAPATAIHVVDPRPDRRELAIAFGAAGAHAPGAPAIADLRADAAFDCVGGGALSRDAVAALRPGGTAVLFAHAKPGEAPAFELNELFKHEKRLVGAYSGSLAEQARIFDLLASGALRPAPLVTHRLPLAAFDDGVALARRQEALKVVFHP